MSVTVETLEKLERKIILTLPENAIKSEVDTRLRKLARTVKMDGFRPGKIPINAISQRYGYSVYHEILNDKLGKAFSAAANEARLRVVGQPLITPSQTPNPEGMVAFDAVFEVYPDVQAPDLATLEVKKFNTEVNEEVLNKTIDFLRKQKRSFTPRPDGASAQDTDRVTVDFEGKIDGEPFEGGKADNFQFILGEGQMLKAFEEAAIGMKTGESKTFQLQFPADYHGKDVAGKTADFMLSIKSIEETHLPEVDQEFARSLGSKDGSVESLRAELVQNLEREVNARLLARNKQNVMDALLSGTTLDVPQASVQTDMERMLEAMRTQLKERGMKDADKAQLPVEMFRSQAERRVRLGLILAELVRTHGLQATPEQVRAYIEDMAASFENPAEVVRFHLTNNQKIAEAGNLVTEKNVVEFVFAHAKISSEDITVDALMANS
ncbi:MAG: trigger factor [Rhodoferax sp.]|nr:trigger factor [Rhodoferax sp.]